MKKVFIVHGWGGIPNGGWFPWLMKELALLDIPAVSLLMPNTNNPNVDEWTDTINKYMGEDSENIILLGHSLGVIAALRYLEKYLENKKINGIVLVSGFAEILEKDNPQSDFRTIDNFFTPAIKMDVVKNISNKSIVINGDADTIVPVYLGKNIAKDLDCEIMIVPNGDHFSQKTKPICYELPEALDAILKIINK